MAERSAQERDSRFGAPEKREVDGHSITIRYPNPEAVAALEGRIADTEFTDEMLRPQIATLIAMLKLPIITDDFGNQHEARRAWRTGLLEKGLTEEHALLEQGLLRGNNIGALSVFDALKAMQQHLGRFAVVNGQNPEHFSEIVNAGLHMLSKVQNEYEQMDTAQRLVFVERSIELVEKAVWGLVKLFEKA
ncbi:hypothetical protein K2Y00_03045 [Patescibacteria group bacterium]|nr:hypothetical protein [Patescibacteria group bacterium]